MLWRGPKGALRLLYKDVGFRSGSCDIYITMMPSGLPPHQVARTLMERKLDFVSKEKRSNIMRAVRSKDTEPERRVRSLLHKNGYRFRIHDAKLPGKPDIVLPRHMTVIFVHGCFWHHHVGCKHGRFPTSNSAYWRTKIERTRQRDVRHTASLKQDGWTVITIWECELGDSAQLLSTIKEAIGFAKEARG